MKTTGRKTQKVLNFDLDTKTLEENLGSKTKGYYIVRGVLKDLGFDWRQGSGYVSREKLNVSDINNMIDNLVERLPWLPPCTKRFDVSNVSKQQFSVVKQMEISLDKTEERMKEDPVYAMKVKAIRKRENANADGVTAQFSTDRARTVRGRNGREADVNER